MNDSHEPHTRRNNLDDFEGCLAAVNSRFTRWSDDDSNSYAESQRRRNLTLAVTNFSDEVIAYAHRRAESLFGNVLDRMMLRISSSLDTAFNYDDYSDPSMPRNELERLNDWEFARVIDWVIDTLIPELNIEEFSTIPPTNDEIDLFNSLEKKVLDVEGEYLSERRRESDREDQEFINQERASGNKQIILVEDLRRRVTGLETEFSNYSEILTEISESHQSIPDLIQRASQATKDFNAVRNQYEALNEKKSKDKLVGHFEKFYKKHNLISWSILGVSLVLIGATATFSVLNAIHLPREISSDLNYLSTLAWKVTIAGGGTALSTYLLRLASYHRKLAVWGDTVQLQLLTFAPYIQQIGVEASKDTLRLEFARRVFGNEPGNTPADKDNSSDLATMAELSSILANISKLQKSGN